MLKYTKTIKRLKCGFMVVSSGVKVFQKSAFQRKIVDERGPMKQNKHFTQAMKLFLG